MWASEGISVWSSSLILYLSNCQFLPQLLSSGQYYTIGLEMELPESPVNEEVGMFMVNVTFYTTERRFLSTSARPVRWSGRWNVYLIS